jgi:uroporphyrinogen-III synthase
MSNDKTKPLAGKRVVVTRAPEQAQDLIRELEQFGAEVLLLPTVASADPVSYAGLDAALGQVAEFDWIVFTSRNAVRYFTRRCRPLGVNCAALPPKVKVAAVGPATAQAAAEFGLRVDRVAAEHRGSALAAELRDSFAGGKILLPRSDRAGADLPTALRAAGAEVTDVVAYRTLEPVAISSSELARIRAGEADVVTFASPSAFHNFAEFLSAEELDAVARRVHFAAIGPTTAGAIADAGFPVAIQATESTSAGLALAIARFFEQHAGVKTP